MKYALALKHTHIVSTATTDRATSADKYSLFYTPTIRKLETTERESERPQSESGTLSDEKQTSTHLNSKDQLIERIKRGPKDRAKFVASHVDKGIAYQIRALRDRQNMSQEELAALVGMNQNAISRLESPERGRPTITTLKRLAEAFDVALTVRFAPFSKLINWVSGTPFIEEGLSTESLAVPKFGEELQQGKLEITGRTIIPEMRISLKAVPNAIYYYQSTEPINCCSGNYISRPSEPSRQDLDKYFFAIDAEPNQRNLFGERPMTRGSISTFDPRLVAGVVAQQQTHGSERKYDNA